MGKEIHRNIIEKGDVSNLEMLLTSGTDSGITYRLNVDSGRKTLTLPAKTSEADAREVWLETECAKVWPPKSPRLKELHEAEASNA